MARAESVPLGVFALAPQAPGGVRVFARIEPAIALKLASDVIDQPHVEILAAELHVAVGGQSEKIVAANLHHGHVERAAPQVVNEQFARLVRFALSIQKAFEKAVGDRGGSGLVDDVQDVEPGHVAGVLRGFAAHFVEISRHGDDHLAKVADLAAGVEPQLVEHEGLNRFGRIFASGQQLMKRAIAQVVLGALGHVIGFGGDGFERLFAHYGLRSFEQHDAGRDEVAFGVDQRHRPASVVDVGDGRVGGAQVDANCGCLVVRHQGRSGTAARVRAGRLLPIWRPDRDSSSWESAAHSPGRRRCSQL